MDDKYRLATAVVVVDVNPGRGMDGFLLLLLLLLLLVVVVCEIVLAAVVVAVVFMDAVEEIVPFI